MTSFINPDIYNSLNYLPKIFKYMPYCIWFADKINNKNNEANNSNNE